jgi:Uracil phosphoribosyltransferase
MVDLITPLERATGVALVRPIVLVPILRAGLGMVDGVWPLAPSAQIAHIGIYRDEATARPQPYYSKFPPTLETANVFLLDPMLAPGQSAVEAANQLKTFAPTSSQASAMPVTDTSEPDRTADECEQEETERTEAWLGTTPAAFPGTAVRPARRAPRPRGATHGVPPLCLSCRPFPFANQRRV